MSGRLRDRHLVGAGAAACAACCAAPVVTFLGLAGAAATVASVVFVGAAFGLVVAAAALFAVWRRRQAARACEPAASGPVDVAITTGPQPDPPL